MTWWMWLIVFIFIIPECFFLSLSPDQKREFIRNLYEMQRRIEEMHEKINARNKHKSPHEKDIQK